MVRHQESNQSTSFEKVVPSKTPAYCPMKTLFARAAMRNLGPELSVQSKDFELKHIIGRGLRWSMDRPLSPVAERSLICC